MNWKKPENVAKMVLPAGVKEERIVIGAAQKVISAAPEAPAVKASGNPVCPSCGTIYNRNVVIDLLKKQSPEMFTFATWTTKFRCKKCPEVISISGSGNE